MDKAVDQESSAGSAEIHRKVSDAKASAAIRPAINNNENVAAIALALGLSFHDRRLVAVISSPSA
jgi:hypothetical protein